MTSSAVSANMIAEAVKPRSAKGWLWLYEIELDTDTSESRWLLLTSNPETVTFDSDDYIPAPISHEKQVMGRPGDTGDLTVTLSNIGGVPSDVLLAHDGLRGRRLIIRLVHEDLLSTVSDSFAAVYRIGDPVVTPEAVALPCGMGIVRRAIGNHFSRLRCGYLFADAETCGWVAALGGDSTGCDFSLDGTNGCDSHGNVERFGGWPSMP